MLKTSVAHLTLFCLSDDDLHSFRIPGFVCSVIDSYFFLFILIYFRLFTSYLICVNFIHAFSVCRLIILRMLVQVCLSLSVLKPLD